MNAISDTDKEKYSRLEEEESDASDDLGETSLNDADGAGGSSVFRSSSYDKHDEDETHEIADESLLDSSLHREIRNNRQLRTTSSFEMDDDDWDEDDAGLRRYNLDFKKIPDDFQPAEFESLPKRIYMKYLNLRISARQRQAARLLNMPSETFFYKCHSFSMTICDATDQGIMLVAACLSLWLFIGLVAPVSPFYWLTGVAVFIVRVSARRIVEYLQGSRFRQHRLRLSSIELGSDSSYRETPTTDAHEGQEIV